MLRNQYLPDEVSPPGETLNELLEERGMSQKELAERMSRPKKTINEIIKGKAALTSETALQLERVLGTPAAFWNERERQYRDYLARADERASLRSQVEWLKSIPVKQMIRLGWLAEMPNKVTQLQEVLSYFGVVSPDAWRKHYREPQVSYRRSTAMKTDPGPLSAWLRQGERQALESPCAAFDRKRFRDALVEARALTNVDNPQTFFPRLRHLCGAAGVAVVLVSPLVGMSVRGVTRWLSREQALIQLSQGFESTDQLWFTFFHEAGHILLHGKKLVFLEDRRQEGEKEEQANRFARNFLIPQRDYDRISSRPITEERVRRFAEELGIAPGIVVGRLQHDGSLPPGQLNSLKVPCQL